MTDHHLAEIAIVARGLAELADDVAFVGGASIGLYIDDLAAPKPRTTDDVDCVIEVASRGAHARLQERLHELGFQPDTSEGAPVCRWIFRGVKVDVMPTDTKILGFTNRWYAEAMQHRRKLRISASQSVWGFPLPYLIASKLEAFRGRGAGDWLASHDIEDIIALLDGARTAFDEMRATTGELGAYLRKQFRALSSREDAFEIIQGHVRPGPTSSAAAARVLAAITAFSSA